jgi:5-methylcytosine-specific restriction endonuclease McrA
MKKFINSGQFKKGVVPKTHFPKGHIPWNKGTKGVVVAWNKDKKCPYLIIRNKSEKQRKAVSISRMGNKNPMFGKIGYWAGKKRPKISKKTREKMASHKGEERYNYIKDRTVQLEKSRIRNTVDWKQWRIEVFSRDKYTCQECGAMGVFLEPHHIEPIRVVGLNSKKLFEVTNGITLCRPCHNKTRFKESNFESRYSQLVVAHS